MKLKSLEPDKLNIAPCVGCDVCQCSKDASIRMDTNPGQLIKIVAADMILLLTPVYCGECQQ